MKITTVAELPEALGKAWLQHLRDFDTAHTPHCHFQVLASGEAGSMQQACDMLKIDPPPQVMQLFARDDARDDAHRLAGSAMGIADTIKPQLAGLRPEVQGAILMELVAMYFAGHCAEIRSEIMDGWGQAVMALTEINAEQLWKGNDRAHQNHHGADC